METKGGRSWRGSEECSIEVPLPPRKEEGRSACELLTPSAPLDGHLSIYLSVCLSIPLSLSIHLSIHRSLYQSIQPAIPPFMRLSFIYMSSICPCIHYPSIVHLSIHSCVYHSVRPSITTAACPNRRRYVNAHRNTKGGQSNKDVGRGQRRS